MTEITEDKFEELFENVEKMLKYGGKAMSCVDALKRKNHMSERNNMDYRDGGYMNERDDDDEDAYRMHERYNGGRMNERYNERSRYGRRY